MIENSKIKSSLLSLGSCVWNIHVLVLLSFVWWFPSINDGKVSCAPHHTDDHVPDVLMWSNRYRLVELWCPQEATRCLLPGPQHGSRPRGHSAPRWVGGVGGRRVHHQLELPFKFNQPWQDVIQQHGYSPLQVSCGGMETDDHLNEKQKTTARLCSWRTVTSHRGSLWTAECVLVLFREDLDVLSAEFQYLLA